MSIQRENLFAIVTQAKKREQSSPIERKTSYDRWRLSIHTRKGKKGPEINLIVEDTADREVISKKKPRKGGARLTPSKKRD